MQAQNLDSLWGAWNDQTAPDSTRVEAYYDYIWDGFLFSNPDTAFILAEELRSFGEKKNYPLSKAKGHTLQGVSLHLRGDYSKALEHYTQSLAIHRQNDDQKGVANSLNNIGLIYANLGDYPKALDYYQNALNILEKIGDKKEISNTLNNIGNIYSNQGDYLQALDHYQRCLIIQESVKSKKGIAAGLNNIGVIYQYQGDYPKALDNFQRSLSIYEEMGDKYGIADALNNSGIMNQDQSDYPKALNNFQRSLSIYEGIGDKNGIAFSLNDIGSLYQKQGDLQRSINECSKGLLLAREIGAIPLQRGACQCLYDAYKSTGNGNKALEYHEQMLALDDSLNAEETTKQLQQMEFAKQMLADSLQQEEEKLKVEMAHEREVAKNDKTRNMLMGGGLLLLLAAIGLYSRVRYVRKAKNRIEKEKDRSENLLLNILPAEIAEELKEKGEASARDFDLVSILFTDFKGFTQASEKLSAADLVAEINTCFKAFDGIVGKYNIEKIKTIGDAYMCAGGLPVPDENAAKNTVHAGLEMQAFMKARKAERDKQGLPAFEMRVGIHTGPVVAGIVGVKKFQYDIWGDTVNTASRMESSGEVGQVNISDATYDLVKENPEFDFTSRGKIEAKGKGQLEMFFVGRST